MCAPLHILLAIYIAPVDHGGASLTQRNRVPLLPQGGGISERGVVVHGQVGAELVTDLEGEVLEFFQDVVTL